MVAHMCILNRTKQWKWKIHGIARHRCAIASRVHEKQFQNVPIIQRQSPQNERMKITFFPHKIESQPPFRPAKDKRESKRLQHRK